MDIVNLKKNDSKAVLYLLKSVTKSLQEEGIQQWDRFYPNRFVVRKDISSKTMFGIRDFDQILAVVTINSEENRRYNQIQWKENFGNPVIIHRLAVHPKAQGIGLGKRLLHFAEQTASYLDYSSVRLDVYAGNPKALALYTRNGYEKRGEITFPFRKMPYICMEKQL